MARLMCTRQGWLRWHQAKHTLQTAHLLLPQLHGSAKHAAQQALVVLHPAPLPQRCAQQAALVHSQSGALPCSLHAALPRPGAPPAGAAIDAKVQSMFGAGWVCTLCRSKLSDRGNALQLSFYCMLLTSAACCAAAAAPLPGARHPASAHAAHAAATPLSRLQASAGRGKHLLLPLPTAATAAL